MEGELSLLINKNYPYISDKTVKYFKEAFPDKLPTKQVSEFELGKLIGKQEIIRHLEFINKQQYESNDEEND